MKTSPVRRLAPLVLLIVFALLQSACTPPECDPNSPQYSPQDCETVIGNFLKYLTQLAYGTPPPPPRDRNTCPAPVVCFYPECALVQENGSFEVDGEDHLRLWAGDEATQTNVPVCHKSSALEFEATTPNGPSASASAQVYQVIDYAGLLEGLQRDVMGTMHRVRASAAFGIFLPNEASDRQFGLRIDAYRGDPATFPRQGDPEAIPTQTSTYEQIATVEETLMYDLGGDEWQPLEAAMMVPEDTDFLVVLLEAVENVQNDEQGEFGDHGVDYVRVALDGGNTPPVAVLDNRNTGEDTPLSISVLANDYDATSRLDEGSLSIVSEPIHGTVEVQASGRVRYTPELNYTGDDIFHYTVADEEGLVSEETPVIITVRPRNDAPVARNDAYDIPEGSFLTVPTGLGVLANDTDVDRDTLTAVLVDDVTAGVLRLDPTGAFTYNAPSSWSGTMTFTYRASDGEATSDTATVSLTRPATGYDLALDKTVSPTSVGPSGEATFTVTVTNNGPTQASGIAVTDQVPDFETTVQSTSTSQGTFIQETGLWNVGTLAAGETATLTITALIHLNATNTASITGGLEGDFDASNDSDDAVVTVEDNAPNTAPQISDPIDNISVRADPPGSCSFDLDGHFTDPDGDALSYSYSQSGNVVNVTLSGSTLSVTGLGNGQASITVTADDPGGLNASDTFTATSGATTDCGDNSVAP